MALFNRKSPTLSGGNDNPVLYSFSQEKKKNENEKKKFSQKKDLKSGLSFPPESVGETLLKFNIKHLWDDCHSPEGWAGCKKARLCFISRGNETQIKLASFLVISTIARCSRLRV